MHVWGHRTERSLFSGPRNSKGVTRDLEVLLTTVCFIRVIAAVIHAVAFPHQADAHAVLALEAELVARAVELGVLGCTEGNQRVSMEKKGLRETHHGGGRKVHPQRPSGLRKAKYPRKAESRATVR